MSCDYDFFCVDCEEHCGLGDLNHAGEQLTEVLRHRDALAGLAAALGPLNSDRELMQSYHVARMAKFFAGHVGHRVRVRDEYGGFFDDCCEHVACGECGSSYRCVLKQGHDGQHQHGRER